MLALSPLFSTLGWPLEEDQVSHEQNWIPSTDPLMDFNYKEPEIELDNPWPSGAISGDPSTVKKLNHNASERDRRKKLNSLYTSLRSLLPATDQTKKLSIPATISRVLKYIPDLQKQVERLIQRKEEILSSISKKGDDSSLYKQRNGAVGPSLPTVSVSRVEEREVVIQICTFKVKKSSLSEILKNLEGEDLQIINASAFALCGNRVFYNLHLQVKESQRLECEMLSEKILSLCERKGFFP